MFSPFGGGLRGRAFPLIYAFFYVSHINEVISPVKDHIFQKNKNISKLEFRIPNNVLSLHP